MNAIMFITRRELSTYFNSLTAYIVVILFLLITGGMFWNEFFQGFQELSLRSLFSNAPLFLAFFAPAITMGLVAEEKRSGTLELMMTMPVSDTQIIVGKFLAAVILLCRHLPVHHALRPVAVHHGQPRLGADHRRLRRAAPAGRDLRLGRDHGLVVDPRPDRRHPARLLHLLPAVHHRPPHGQLLGDPRGRA
ncbi:MAG: hypothetical protein CMH57_04880 [Myxococcales bacterium]|nr:hypothetical protein [Myxococcales bacterium]